MTWLRDRALRRLTVTAVKALAYGATVEQVRAAVELGWGLHDQGEG